MQIVEQSKQQIKAAISQYWSQYRWSQRQVTEHPENRFEWGVLMHNRFAVKCLIADYRRAAAIADARQVVQS